MNKIVAATDFSPVSKNAMFYAADLALKIKAELVLVNVYTLPVTYSDGMITPMPVEDLRKFSEDELDKLKAELLARSGPKLSVETRSRLGDVTDQLIDLCNSIRPMLLVIGARGKTNLERTIYGSAALSIIRHLACPVLCIPPKALFGAGIGQIGYACDFKEVEQGTTINSIKNITNHLKAGWHILHVDHKDKHFNSQSVRELAAVYSMFIEENPTYHFIDHEDIEDGILNFIQDKKLDLLIVVPKKHQLLERFFKPASTKQLLAGSPVPILCVH